MFVKYEMHLFENSNLMEIMLCLISTYLVKNPLDMLSDFRGQILNLMTIEEGRVL